MSFVAALQALVATGAFAARAFLPLFVLSLIARFPGLVTWIPFAPDPPILLPEALAWLASPWCLVALGILSLVEVHADKDPDLREILRMIEAPLKALAAVVATLALAGPDRASLLRHLTGGPSSGGVGGTGIALSVIAGVVAFALTRWRRSGLDVLHDVSDDLGLSRLISWLEDAWVLAAACILVLAPFLAVVLALAALGIVALVRRALERQEDSRRVPCPACQRPTLPAAQACAGCGAAIEPTGEPSSRAWPDRWLDIGPGLDPRDRGLELLAIGRCPACAERRPATDLLASLPHSCGWPAARPDLPDEGWRLALLHRVDRRARRLMLPVAIVGLVPIAGAATALVLSRARISAPLRRWLPVTRRLRARWTARLLVGLLLLLSGLPFACVIVGPLIVAVTWRTWSRAFAATE